MPYGVKRGYSDFLTGRQVRELREASAFAGRIGKPLLHRIHINWSRTSLGDDRTGRALAQYRARISRWLRDRGASLYAVAVRERPTHPAPKPNDHMHLHVPDALINDFRRAVVSLLPPEVRALDKQAIVFDEMGWTEPARAGALNYLCKGAAPKAARLLGIDHENQGRVYGKRYAVTENLGPSARQREAMSAARPDGAGAIAA